MSNNPARRSSTVDSSWPKLAPNANTTVGVSLSTATGPAKKLSLPASSTSSSRSANSCEVALDEFQKVGPGGVATLPKQGDGDERCAEKLSKSLNGLEESRLNAGTNARPSSLARPPSAYAPAPRVRPAQARPTTPTPLPRINTQVVLSYRDVAIKPSLSPPASPTLAASTPLPKAAAPKPSAALKCSTTTTPTLTRNPSLPPLILQTPKRDTNANATSNDFPPLSPSVSSAPPKPWSSTPASTPASKSYANAALHAPPPGSGAALAQAVMSSPESPVCTPAKVISLNIGATTPLTRRASNASAPTPPRPPPSPTTAHGKKRRNKSSGSVDARGFLVPTPSQASSRQRSPSLSSVVTFSSSASISPMTGNTSTVSLPPRPSWESEAWYPLLVEFARAMPRRSRLAWEKILRSNPKDTSKMKWAEFDAALKALGFESKARGGSDLEYTPSKFGDAQPISYHRPHPGQEFSLGDLKAKGHSFRQRYPGPVAALHEAWDLVDTRC